MKTWKFLAAAILATLCLGLWSFRYLNADKRINKTTYRSIPQGCVFRTVMGEESSDSSFVYFSTPLVESSIKEGLAWLMRAQHPSGGWGAGTHARQDVMDPHAVPADPATTSMVGMALLRSGNTPTRGKYAEPLRRALLYVVTQAEQSSPTSPTVTEIRGTQIQSKLGANIDVILSTQFLSNALNHLQHDEQMTIRVQRALDKCVKKIQQSQNQDGSFAGSGWAGVLQSSFATTALEEAKAQGANVDDQVLNRSRDFQKGNYNPQNGDVKTDLGAGVILYSVSGSTRASAKEARRVEEEMDKAKRQNRLPSQAAPTAENLEKIGFGKDEALRHATAYEVYQSAKLKSQQADVMDGFGSNGGEEFLSYLQTGESMIVGKDPSWTNWYDNISGRLLNIQNDDGSWSGHHCITSPVFCTATCVLILSVNNDVERLMELGR